MAKCNQSWPETNPQRRENPACLCDECNQSWPETNPQLRTWLSESIGSVTNLGLRPIRNCCFILARLEASVTNLGLRPIRNYKRSASTSIDSVTNLGLRPIRNALT